MKRHRDLLKGNGKRRSEPFAHFYGCATVGSRYRFGIRSPRGEGLRPFPIAGESGLECGETLNRRWRGHTSPEGNWSPSPWPISRPPPKRRRNPFRRFALHPPTQEIRPEKFAEGGRILGVSTGKPEFAGQTTERIVDEVGDSFRNIGVITSAALRSEFRAPVSERHFPISISAGRRPIRECPSCATTPRQY